MKRCLISIFIVCLFFQATGCYSFSTIENIKFPNFADYEDTEIEVTLKDGSIVYSGTFLHTSNFNQTDFIIGKGDLFDPASAIHKKFEGKIQFTEIKSRNITGNFLTVTLNSNKEILFRENDYLTFYSDTPKGNWLIIDNVVTMIDNENISSVEISKFDPLLSFGSVLLIPIIIVGFVGLMMGIFGTPLISFK